MNLTSKARAKHPIPHTSHFLEFVLVKGCSIIFYFAVKTGAWSDDKKKEETSHSIVRIDREMWFCWVFRFSFFFLWYFLVHDVNFIFVPAMEFKWTFSADAGISFDNWLCFRLSFSAYSSVRKSNNLIRSAELCSGKAPAKYSNSINQSFRSRRDMITSLSAAIASRLWEAVQTLVDINIRRAAIKLN